MKNFIESIMDWIALASIGYFFAVNTAYLFLLSASAWALSLQAKKRPLLNYLNQNDSAFAPSVSILAPAYNEEATVVESVKSFLMLEYPSFEIIVINDGSKDNTLQRLIENFALEKINPIYDNSLSSTEVRGAYQSQLHPQLKVIDKENGGKADALNIGIGFSRYDIFCAVDSDSLLEKDALSKVAAPFLDRSSEVIASGGTVRIANGSQVKFGRVDKVNLPKNFLVLMQIIEYTRAFLCGRIGWNVFNSTLVISGAFGLFSKKAVKAVGGYMPGCIGEDMELVIRLHRHYRAAKKPYSIVFVPDPVCWTEAPSDISTLGKQRDRWQRGLADTLFRHRKMFLNPKYGFIGWVAFPYFLIVELLGPLIEVAAISLVIFSLFYSQMDHMLLISFFVASVLYGAILSVGSLIIEEIYFSKYDRIRHFLTLFASGIAESVLYRPLTTYWRLRGLFKYLKGDHTWGQMKRAGFDNEKKKAA